MFPCSAPRTSSLVHGATSRTQWIRRLNALATPLFPVLERIAPHWVTTTERLGQATLEAARNGATQPVLEPGDIDRLWRAVVHRDGRAAETLRQR